MNPISPMVPPQVMSGSVDSCILPEVTERSTKIFKTIFNQILTQYHILKVQRGKILD